MNDGRSHWQLDDSSRVVTWTAARPPRAVEGPLDLACFADRVLILELEPAQVACRETGGCLRQVILDGAHRLDIGTAGGQIPPQGRLYFLRPDVPIGWRWHKDAHLVIATDPAGVSDGDAAAGVRLALRGLCSLHIADPVRFYTEILRGLADVQPEHLAGVLDALVRSQLATHLQPLIRRGDLDQLRAQVLLTNLTAADLSDDLGELGLGCLHLAACTAHIHAPSAAPAPPMTPVCGSYDDVL